ncbi:hypothetical protein PYCCODRAFT_475600 [Trametes coccinea BRFM310]|uniref:Uncharacterized protein n=1 Tax=Trametes coccinea (strain BRFM310) TaxID=1353009 RepID=A0A1Y2IKW7_TRAC3|nr:hypothetical protein PYCCODRAFT_475600 [Trametes coccinea BRFM310]
MDKAYLPILRHLTTSPLNARTFRLVPAFDVPSPCMIPDTATRMHSMLGHSATAPASGRHSSSERARFQALCAPCDNQPRFPSIPSSKWEPRAQSKHSPSPFTSACHSVSSRPARTLSGLPVYRPAIHTPGAPSRLYRRTYARLPRPRR